MAFFEWYPTLRFDNAATTRPNLISHSRSKLQLENKPWEAHPAVGLVSRGLRQSERHWFQMHSASDGYEMYEDILTARGLQAITGQVL